MINLHEICAGFDIVISNPPYHSPVEAGGGVGGKWKQRLPLFHEFYFLSSKLAKINVVLK